MKTRQFIRNGLRIISPLLAIHAPLIFLALIFIFFGCVASTEPVTHYASFLFVIGIMLTSTAAGLVAFSSLLLQSARDLRQLQTPESNMHITSAHLILIVSMLIIPGVLMIALGHSWTIAMLLCCVGLLALNIPLILFSRPWVLGLNKPTALLVIPMVALSIRGVFLSTQTPEQTAWHLLPMMVLLIGLWLWHWRVELTTISTRHNPMRIRTPGDRLISKPKCTASDRRNSYRDHSITDVIKMFLGKPYVLDSRQGSIAFIGLLLMIVLPPLLLFIGFRDFSLAGVSHAWYLTHLFSIYITAILVWVFHMRVVANRFQTTGLAIYELALLPNMGNRRQQLRGMIAGLFLKPTLIVATLFLIAAVTTYYQYHEWLLALRILLVGMIVYVLGGPAFMLGAIAGSNFVDTPEKRKGQLNQATWQPLLQTLYWLPLLLNFTVFDNSLKATHNFIFYFSLVALIAFGIMLMPGIIAVYKLSRRPHPFVEVTE